MTSAKCARATALCGTFGGPLLAVQRLSPFRPRGRKAAVRQRRAPTRSGPSRRGVHLSACTAKKPVVAEAALCVQRSNRQGLNSSPTDPGEIQRSKGWDGPRPEPVKGRCRRLQSFDGAFAREHAYANPKSCRRRVVTAFATLRSSAGARLQGAGANRTRVRS